MHSGNRFKYDRADIGEVSARGSASRLMIEIKRDRYICERKQRGVRSGCLRMRAMTGPYVPVVSNRRLESCDGKDRVVLSWHGTYQNKEDRRSVRYARNVDVMATDLCHAAPVRARACSPRNRLIWSSDIDGIVPLEISGEIQRRLDFSAGGLILKRW